MLETKFLYLFLMIFTVFVPLLRSFENRVAYYKSFGSLFKATAIVGAFFIVWDIWFTDMGVWGFNATYLTGLNLVNLPIEEWLFFVAVPFSCVFIYRVLNYFIQKDILGKYALRISHFLMAFSLAMAVVHFQKIYTFLTFAFLTMFLAWLAYVKKPVWLGRAYLAYAVSMIPFFMVNGVLTGSLIETQVVWYNNAENLGLRMGTIPVEDAFYGMLLIIMNIYLYEHFESKKLIA
jgi:lycopene cyclase domain-containing protein